MLCSTGKRRYGHPALNGVLPQPWLPLKKGQTLANFVDHDVDTNNNTAQNGRRGRKSDAAGGEAVVLTMRRRYSVMRKDVRHLAGKLIGKGTLNDTATITTGTSDEGEQSTLPRLPSTGSASNPWRESGPGPSEPVPSASYPKHRTRRLSYDSATGVMNLSDDDGFPNTAEEDSDEDVRTSGGATPGDEDEEHHLEGETNGNGSEGRRVGRRRSTYWHHPDRKRVSGVFQK